MAAVDNHYSFHGSKYEPCTRLSWVARGNIRLAQDYREFSLERRIDRCNVNLCVHYYNMFQTRGTCFNYTIVFIKRRGKGMRSFEVMIGGWRSLQHSADLSGNKRSNSGLEAACHF